ncbi:hypothetical protein VPH35_134843 [Triticum aestivum]|uniref:DUF6598 domain-containing protein n=1 Tax=Aegilops tauschii TaxID=37682 RepID=R7W934_AEGTA
MADGGVNLLPKSSTVQAPSIASGGVDLFPKSSMRPSSGDAFVTPTLYTYGRIPIDAMPRSFLQSFSIQVMENEEWRIRWPLEGTTYSEDETLMDRWFQNGHCEGPYDELACRRWRGNFCALEVTSALIGSTVAATVICADIIEGSWPDDFRGRVVCRIAPLDKELVLLDSGEGPLQVDPDGRIILQRGVASVQCEGMLTVSVDAYSKTGVRHADCVEFRPRVSLTSKGTCNLGFCRVQFIVGWSYICNKDDLMYSGN